MKKFIIGLLLLVMPLVSWAGAEFDGTDDYVSVNDSPSFDFGTGAFTVSMWFKKVGEGREDIFSKKSADGNDDVDMILQDDETMDIYFKIDGSGGYAVQNGSAFTINEWHSATFGRDGSNNITTYIDGVADGSGTSNGNMDNNDADIWIGSNHDSSMNPTFSFDGQTSGVAIWGAAPTADEVKQLYNSKIKGMTLQTEPPHLKLYLPLDDHTNGTTNGTFADRSGNGNDGTGYGGVISRSESVLSYPPNR